MLVNLPIENFNIPTQIINQSKLNLEKTIFIENDIILIRSMTATGKTKAIAKLYPEIKKEFPHCKLLSIVNLISLAKEQISTFKIEGGINLINYQKSIPKQIQENDSVICINSLEKIMKLPDTYFQNVILFIDEINDVLNAMTHNTTLDSNLNIIYKCLMKLIKNSKKIIYSDATINLNVLNFISCRTENNKTILIDNVNKKFDGIEAIKYNNEDEFYNKLEECIKNKEYFLFGCDIRSKLEKYFEDLSTKYKDSFDSDTFILITSKTNFYLNNASSQFKDKFIFYSPSITTGVSFVLDKISQHQFIYISNNPQINPVSVFQMSCRTRNMKSLIYFCEDIKPQKMKYETLEELENAYKKMIEINDKILRLSGIRTIDEEDGIIKNTYFKIFCYNEFMEQIYRTGFLEHYQNILIKAGFKLVIKGEFKKLDLKINTKQTMLMNQFKDEEIKRFIDICYDTLPDFNIDEKPLDINYELLLKRHEIIGLSNKEDAFKYKIFIQDEHSLQNLFNFQKLFRTDEFISKQLIKKLNESKKEKNLTTGYNKINLLRTFEKTYNISRLDFEFKNLSLENQLTEDIIKLFSNVFRTKKDNLKTKDNVIKYYINLIKNICGDLPIINRNRKGIKKSKIWIYSLEKELLKELFYLTKQKNPSLKNYNLELVERLSGILPDKELPKKAITKEEYEEVEELYNTYLYNNFG